MARTYYSTNNATYTSAMEVQTTKPLDTRVVANTFEDLLGISSSGYKYAYKGLVVYVIDEGCQYVYIGTTGKLTDVKNSANWVKLGGTSDDSSEEFDPADYLEYYQKNLGLGASVVNSVEDLTGDSITNPYVGMIAIVKDDTTTSEDESGMYILIGDDATDITNWQKVTSGANGGDVSSVITTDGTAPSSNDGGISINSNDKDASVEETYVIENLSSGNDVSFVAGTWYTSRGFHSVASDYDIEYETGVDSINLYKDGSSSTPAYIKLFSSDNTNWIELYIPNDTDSSLGFKRSDVTYIADGVETTMTTDTITLPMETPIKFAVSWGMKNMYEDRYVGSALTSSYEFGVDGSTYDDVDIYTTTVLPTVYVYSSNGSKVQVLTEADQPESITETEISSLFDDSEE